MSRISLLVLLLVLSIGQLVWLISVWRRSGFIAALKLFAYGVLALAVVSVQEELGYL